MKTIRYTFLLLVLCCGAVIAAPAWADPCDLDGDGLISQECDGNDCDDNDPFAGVYLDADGDGHIELSCGGADCDDNDDERFPGNTEICDALDRDEDCDLSTFGFRDADGDGFADASCCNVDTDGTRYCGDDCQDSMITVHPIAPDVCDGLDNDCDGVIDQHAENQFADLDRDGHGNPNDPMGRVCAGTDGFSPLSNDCDDSNPAIQPGTIVCDPAVGIDAYQYCASDGQFVTGNVCTTGSVCVAQDNGTGVCIPEKPKEKDKDK